jgi:hypothetical protein
MITDSSSEPTAEAEEIPLGQRRFLSIVSSAAYVDLSPTSIRSLIAAGKLHPRRVVRGKILLDRIELEQLIASSTSTPRKSRGAHLRSDS